MPPSQQIRILRVRQQRQQREKSAQHVFPFGNPCHRFDVKRMPCEQCGCSCPDLKTLLGGRTLRRESFGRLFFSLLDCFRRRFKRDWGQRDFLVGPSKFLGSNSSLNSFCFALCLRQKIVERSSTDVQNIGGPCLVVSNLIQHIQHMTLLNFL